MTCAGRSRTASSRGFGAPDRAPLYVTRRRLARALRALEEAAFDPMVRSAAELAEAEEAGADD